MLRLLMIKCYIITIYEKSTVQPIKTAEMVLMNVRQNGNLLQERKS